MCIPLFSHSAHLYCISYGNALWRSGWRTLWLSLISHFLFSSHYNCAVDCSFYKWKHWKSLQMRLICCVAISWANRNSINIRIECVPFSCCMNNVQSGVCTTTWNTLHRHSLNSFSHVAVFRCRRIPTYRVLCVYMPVGDILDTHSNIRIDCCYVFSSFVGFWIAECFYFSIEIHQLSFLCIWCIQ